MEKQVQTITGTEKEKKVDGERFGQVIIQCTIY